MSRPRWATRPMRLSGLDLSKGGSAAWFEPMRHPSVHAATGHGTTNGPTQLHSQQIAHDNPIEGSYSCVLSASSRSVVLPY
jgi:hypothetical protein